jgi:2-keto-3-deoxy-L-rhamnonate aldolase RhmA
MHQTLAPPFCGDDHEHYLDAFLGRIQALQMSVDNVTQIENIDSWFMALEDKMAIVYNHTKQTLAEGKLALGVGLRQARTVDIGKILKTAGFDWLFIDMEHNAMTIDTATQIAVAGQDAGITPLVRVPGFEHHHASRALDCGAQGIVAPHVDDAETAARIVSACRYPPHGKRSMTGGLPQLDFVPTPLNETVQVINDSTLVVVMVESPEAVANADALAATEGVDIVLIGTNDLCMEMGIPGQFDHDQVADAYARVGEACKKHKKTLGMGGVYNPVLMEKYIGLGARFILSGSDLSFLMLGASARAQELRALSIS